jgi:predicted dehydrogenase
MQPVRIGVIGTGNMGLQHAANLRDGAVEGAILTALSSRSPESRAKVAGTFPNIPAFASLQELIASKTCDAVIIATPHIDHPRMVIDAFKANLHVLVEKPLAASIQAANEVIAAYRHYPHLKFGIMHNQRASPLYQKIKELIAANEMGTISRITWIITDWFRTHAYYASSPWRATWKGEGGGVLINQSTHNLDLLQWVTGLMPSRITAVAFTGKTHPIEVEDEVSAILEYPNGAIGHFITTTGEFPGANRLEIAGSRGQIVAERNTLTFTRTAVDTQDFNRTSPLPFGTPDAATTQFQFPAAASLHYLVMRDFVNAIRNDTPNNQLLAPGPDGVHALELANAMLMSGLTHQPVSLPLNPHVYESFLNKLMQA